MTITRAKIFLLPSYKIKIYECKLCKYKGERKDVRKHYKEKHFWNDGNPLSSKIKSQEFQ